MNGIGELEEVALGDNLIVECPIEAGRGRALSGAEDGVNGVMLIVNIRLCRSNNVNSIRSILKDIIRLSYSKHFI